MKPYRVAVVVIVTVLLAFDHIRRGRGEGGRPARADGRSLRRQAVRPGRRAALHLQRSTPGPRRQPFLVLGAQEGPRDVQGHRRPGRDGHLRPGVPRLGERAGEEGRPPVRERQLLADLPAAALLGRRRLRHRLPGPGQAADRQRRGPAARGQIPGQRGLHPRRRVRIVCGQIQPDRAMDLPQGRRPDAHARDHLGGLPEGGAAHAVPRPQKCGRQIPRVVHRCGRAPCRQSPTGSP